MNETAAREVVLLRAFETASPRTDAWSDEDRAWASRAASEVVGADASVDRFLARRAALGVERLSARDPKIGRALRVLQWRGWIAGVVIVIAFALGVAVDAIGPAHRVNILAFPMLALLLWNLSVYALLAGSALSAIARRQPLEPGPLRRTIARVGLGLSPSHVPVNASTTLVSFTRDWLRLSSPLIAARVAVVLHAAAFAFALGAIASLYLRGIVFEYRAGWESTFLDAAQVQRLLAFVLAPASAITGIAVADAQHLAPIRFPESAGENAAAWLHLYATTIVLFVLLPRALLAYVARWRERRLSARFPLRMDDAYFQGLQRLHRGEAARIRIVPYSHQLSPQATLALQSIMTRLYGPSAQVLIAATIPFGDEDDLPGDLLAGDTPAIIVVLFNMSATPEAEHHCAVIEALRQHERRRAAPSRESGGSTNATPILALIDESAFRQRFGDQPARMEERRTAWRRLLETIGQRPVFVDLASPNVIEAEAAMNAALDNMIGQPAA